MKSRRNSESRFGLYIVRCGEPEVGPVLQRAYKMLRGINVPECAIFKQSTLRSTVLKNLLKIFGKVAIVQTLCMQSKLLLFLFGF